MHIINAQGIRIRTCGYEYPIDSIVEETLVSLPGGGPGSTTDYGGISLPTFSVAHLDFGWPFHWLSDVLNWMIDALTYPIRLLGQFFFSYLPSMVHWITVEYEKIKYHLGQDLAQFYNTTLGFWVMTVSLAVIVVGAAVLGPEIVAFFSSGGGAAAITAIEAEAGKFAAYLHLNTFVEISRIAQVLFPSWRNVWASIYQDVGSIMGDIGYGFGTMAALLTAGKSTLLLTYSMMGMDQKTADTLALSQMSNYVSGLSSKFDDYAANPQDIWNDFYENVVLPQTGAVSSQIAKVLGAVVVIGQKVDDAYKLIQSPLQFEETYQKAFGLTPPKQYALIQSEVQTSFDQINTGYVQPINRRIDAIQKSIGPLVAADEAHNKEIAAQQKQIEAAQNTANNADAVRASFDTVAPEIPNFEADTAAYFSDTTIARGDRYLLAMLDYFDYATGQITEEQLNQYLGLVESEAPAALQPPTMEGT